MTLLIACLLIYHTDLPVWWYAIAVTIWGCKQFALDHIIKTNVKAIVGVVRQG